MISVVIPTYKREPSVVSRAVQSALNQTYRDIEVLVVDDSPATYAMRDAVRDGLLALNDPRVSYIRHEKNMGACHARNTGVRAAKGEFVAFLDDDDEWLEEKLAMQMDKMRTGDYGLVYCRELVVDETNDETREPQRAWREGWVFDELIRENFIGSTSFALLPKSCVLEAGLFDPAMPSAQDVDLWLRVAKNHRIGFVDRPLVRYYVHAGESISGNPQKKADGSQRLIEKNIDYLRSHRAAYGIRLVKLALLRAKNNERAPAWRAYWQGVLKRPYCVRDNARYFRQIVRASRDATPRDGA